MSLPGRYTAALDEAVAYIHRGYAPDAIVVSGTIIRGNPHPQSDLDIVVVHEPAWRQRVQREFNGVPVEMFVNPAFQIRRQMEDDARQGRPVMAHMLATGAIIHDSRGIAAALRDEAIACLETGPKVDPGWLELRRYGIATMYEDAVDIDGIDSDRAQSLVVEALVEGAKWYFMHRGHWLPRSKALLGELDRLDADVGHGVRGALRRATHDGEIAAAAPVLEELIGATRFFEWESEPQNLP